jgi:hypothetical protein
MFHKNGVGILRIKKLTIRRLLGFDLKGYNVVG